MTASEKLRRLVEFSKKPWFCVGVESLKSFSDHLDTLPDVFIPPDESSTLRDHFAGVALQGMLSGCGNEGFRYSFEEYATTSYQIADAMLKARQS